MLHRSRQSVSFSLQWLGSSATVLVVVASLQGVPRVDGAEMALVPSYAEGPYILNGNEIIIPAGGVRVFVDVFMSNFAPDRLNCYQADVAQDGSAFSGGTAGSLSFSRPACTQPGDSEFSSECAAAFGVTSPAGSVRANCLAADSLCVPQFLDQSRSDVVYQRNRASSDPVESSWVWAGSDLTIVGTYDVGVPVYGGTYVIEVSPDAAGTFSVELVSPAAGGTTMLAFAGVMPVTISPALITISAGSSTVPAVSTWGLVALSLTLLVGARLYFDGRRNVHA